MIKSFAIDLANKVAEVLYVELAANELDRATWRELKKIYGRKLTYSEKAAVLMYRMGSEAGRRDKS